MNPERIGSEAELECRLSEPYPETVALMKRLPGNLIVLGVGGKMGTSLAATAARACRKAGAAKRIVGVARSFPGPLRDCLEPLGVELIACDLAESPAVQALPRADNVVFMAGRKFGETGSEPLTWLTNTAVPGHVGQVFRGARTVAFSTGCVYPLVSSDGPGSRETDAPQPVGEYAQSCLGRERIFEYYAEAHGTPTLLLRLNYAVDLRYGVLVDIARAVFEGRPVDLRVGAVNAIWQGDAVNRALLCLELAAAPAARLNITGRRILRVRDLAERFGQRFGKPARFTGTDSGKAYLSDATRSFELFGPPALDEDCLIEKVADWIAQGGPVLDRPTHFSVTDGHFLDPPRKEAHS